MTSPAGLSRPAKPAVGRSGLVFGTKGSAAASAGL